MVLRNKLSAISFTPAKQIIVYFIDVQNGCLSIHKPTALVVQEQLHLVAAEDLLQAMSRGEQNDDHHGRISRDILQASAEAGRYGGSQAQQRFKTWIYAN